MAGSFFDSNVLLYLASDDTRKADRTERLLYGGGTISVQVLNEIANVARRTAGMSWSEIHRFLDGVRALLQVRPISVDTHDCGLALAARYGVSVHDSMIVAAALEADCDTLWSEDMQDGLLVDGRTRVTNPFA